MPHQCQLEVFKDILVQNGYVLHNGRGNTDDITLLLVFLGHSMANIRRKREFIYVC